MQLEIITLCDYAVDNNGKLTVVGTFDTIRSAVFPTAHPTCYLALKFRLANSEAGVHQIEIQGKAPDGKHFMKINGTADVKENPNADYNSVNVVLPFHGLKFEKPGRYTFEMTFNGEFQCGFSLYLVQIPYELGKVA